MQASLSELGKRLSAQPHPRPRFPLAEALRRAGERIPALILVTALVAEWVGAVGLAFVLATFMSGGGDQQPGAGRFLELGVYSLVIVLIPPVLLAMKKAKGGSIIFRTSLGLLIGIHAVALIFIVAAFVTGEIHTPGASALGAAAAIGLAGVMIGLFGWSPFDRPSQLHK